jgi:asparagine synthetase B (glutamine-hydrolysing)
MSRARQAVAFNTLFWPEEQESVLRPEWRLQGAVQRLEELLAKRGVFSESDQVAAAHWMEQRLILPDAMLTKVDRMSMAASLEVRAPLIGGTVVDFAARLPFEAKNVGVDGKRVLRTLARRLVPTWVVDRPKQGFALPLARHGGAVLDEAARFALESSESPLRALFRDDALASLAVSLRAEGEGRDAEDSPFRRVHRRWLLALLARVLVRQGGI